MGISSEEENVSLVCTHVHHHYLQSVVRYLETAYQQYNHNPELSTGDESGHFIKIT